MSIVYAPFVSGTGLWWQTRARNGLIADGPAMASVANALNMITARRGKVLYSSYQPINTYDSNSTPALYGSFFTSPYVGRVYAMALIGKDAAQDYGDIVITLDDTAEHTIHHRDGASSSAGPSDYVVKTVQLLDVSGNAIAGGTAHTFRCAFSNTVPLAGLIIYELPQAYMSTASGGVATDVFSVGNPVVGRDLAALTDQAWLLYKQQGTHQVFWSAKDNGASTRTGTTYANVLDGSTAGYSSSAAGFWTIPYRQATQTGTTVRVVLWCIATASGTTGRVRFVNSAGTIGTITGISGLTSITDLVPYTTTATLDASLTSDLVIIEHSDATGGQTVATYAAGMYCLEV